MRFLVTANFNVEAETEEEAEELFEEYLSDTTVLTDSNSIAFECIEAVMRDDDDPDLTPTDYVEGPDAKPKSETFEEVARAAA